MNEMNSVEGGDVTERDVVVSRVVDGAARASDWRALRALAERDASVWSELERAQSDASALSAVMEHETAGVERAELPGVAGGHEELLNRRVRMVGMWGGWAAAAAVGVAWTIGVGMTPAGVGNGITAGAAGAGVVTDARDVLKKYLDMGRATGDVLGEMPEKVFVEAVPVVTDDGQDAMRVRYIRQIVEQAVVTDMVQFAKDEAGRLAQVRVPVPSVRPAPMPRPMPRPGVTGGAGNPM